MSAQVRILQRYPTILLSLPYNVLAVPEQRPTLFYCSPNESRCICSVFWLIHKYPNSSEIII